jgi:uncharacterized membrane protein
MTKNLEKADTVVKLTLAVSVLVFYFTEVIVGPFAKALAILSGIMIFIVTVKFLYHTKHNSSRKR